MNSKKAFVLFGLFLAAGYVLAMGEGLGVGWLSRRLNAGKQA